MSKGKKKAKEITLMECVVEQATEHLEASSFGAYVEDYVAEELYHKDFTDLPEHKAKAIKAAVKKYMKLLMAISKALKEGLE